MKDGHGGVVMGAKYQGTADIYLQKIALWTARI